MQVFAEKPWESFVIQYMVTKLFLRTSCWATVFLKVAKYSASNSWKIVFLKMFCLTGSERTNLFHLIELLFCQLTGFGLPQTLQVFGLIKKTIYFEHIVCVHVFFHNLFIFSPKIYKTRYTPPATFHVMRQSQGVAAGYGMD